jgi:hypothetical protein
MIYQGDGFVARGSWFELGTTSGSRGQIVQIPNNGGGSATVVPGVQIETAPGSGVYEWWPAVASANFTTTSITTDARARVVQNIGSAQIRIGSNGTNDIGRLPDSGCKIRIPNIILRQCTTGARATNAAPATVLSTRPEFLMGTGGKVDMENVLGDWAFDFSNASVLKLKNVACEAGIRIIHPVQKPILDSVCVTNISGSTTLSATLQLNNVLTGIDILSTVLSRPSNTMVLTVNSLGINAQDLNLLNIGIGSLQAAISLSTTSNSVLNNTKLVASAFTLATCNGVQITNTDYIHRMAGDTNNSGSVSIFSIGTSANVTVDGITFGAGGTISNTHPYGPVFATNGNTGLIKFRNMGTRTSPLNVGGNSSLYPQYIYSASAADNNIMLQRLYLTNVRTSMVNFGALNYNCLVENVYGGSVAQNITFSEDVIYRGLFSSNVGNSWNASGLGQGVNVADYFSSSTAGAIKFAFGQPQSATSSPFSEISVDPANALAGSSGFGVYLPTVGDYVVIETPWSLYAHTAFANAAVAYENVTNSGNLKTEYQLDTGSGYSGTWKLATGANLSGETLDPAVGIKMKVKVSCVTANNSNFIGRVRFDTASTSAAQIANLYPLDTVNLSFTGLQAGSEVRAYLGTDPATSVELAGVESTAGSTFSFTHDKGGQDGYLMIFALGYQPIRIPYTYKSTDDTILIQQVVDRNYSNPT